MANDRPAKLSLLSRAYCSLCDAMLREAAPVAQAHGMAIDVIDIDAHPALLEAWDTLVPVLFLGEPAGGNELCHYHFDAGRVRAALARIRRGAALPT
ncbi:MAG TPA: glutaredoxin family protein [Casimicrobiaceae bacterium]|nr:glutaredoxin family protein [Casimicrobiaceae bacterium]